MQQNSSQQAQNYLQQQPQGMHIPSQAQMQQMSQMQQQVPGYNSYQQNQAFMNLFQIVEQLAESYHPTRQNQKRQKGAPTVEQKHTLPSVYVGNLPKDFYNLDFLQFFKSRGYKVLYAEVKVKEDPNTKRQKRFGFLQFTTPEEAQRCQQEMNNTQIHGHTINMSVCAPGFDEKANVIVRNLAPELTQQKLWEHFAKFGTIKSLKLEEFPDGKSRGFCFIQFDRKEDADTCIKQADQTELCGKKIEVTFHKNKEERYGDNLYVQNLPTGTDDAKLGQMFAEFGQVQSARIQRGDKDTLMRNGYVCFATGDSAQKALDAMNKKQMDDGSFLIVSHHVYSGNAPEGFQKVLQKTFDSNLFVRNVPGSIPEEEVKKIFEKCGPIVSLKKKTGQGKIEGDPAYVPYFILYADVNAAKKAIQEFDQSNVFGSRLLNVEFWESPEELAEKRDQRQWRQVKQFLYPPRSDGMEGPMGQQQQRGGGNPRGRGGKYQGGQRQGAPYGQGPRGQQPQQMQPIMMQANFPSLGGQQMPMEQPQPQPIQITPQIRQQIGDFIYPTVAQKYAEHASKIVGVLLDSPQVDTMKLTKEPNYLFDMAEQVFEKFIKLQQQPQPTPAQQQ